MTDNGVIGIIGYGTMGAAIAKRLRSRYRIVVFEKDAGKTAGLDPQDVVARIDVLCRSAQTVILAVKPQDIQPVLEQVRAAGVKVLVVSIAAGIPCAYLERILGDMRVVRVMPNLAVRVAKGTIALCAGRNAGKQDVSFVQGLFDLLGRTLVIPESLMNAATAVSGSGPGFFFELVQQLSPGQWVSYARDTFIPALAAGAQKTGFTAEQAQFLSEATAEGSIALLQETGVAAALLRDQVTSKGGTTEAGLKALRETGALDAALTAAVKRAGELARQ